ncbi:hypothetical protein HELRODRAFT_114815 [Helobdella robusta]|uniref:Mitochondrial import receptor subunit TOM20 homolog n=1 Tax=Helobdella robusta TaxID=6412 RepID=T1EG46_HELRO|nr:hypothetical protein HELRODRAFT_114815 [Helobdella robusta]ESN95272.1 hypothetical protein HELRODRAFT_114815 [Helobdella robusta]
MISSNALMGLAAGAGAFVLFCFYYDHRRRSDPLYRVKLRESPLLKAKESAKKAKKVENKPDLNDPESCQKFFLREIQLGEELLSQGDIHEGIEHLANALAVCSQPQQLMSVFQQTLPPQVCQLLVAQIPIAAQRLVEGELDGTFPIHGKPKLVEDDLE